MDPKRKVICPHCQGTEFEIEHLGNPATAWKVTFGSQFFRKSELKAYACQRCGFVSLFVDQGESARG
jgi:Zn finger protein HypA/HybF involved in hydrogenase expression